MATWLAGPVVTIPWGFWIARGLSLFLSWTGRRFLLQSKWEIEWRVESDRFPASNISPVRVWSFLSIVALEWSAKSRQGDDFVYRMVGSLHTANKLTGRWRDREADGYGGALQVIFSHLRDSASGMWLGFSQDGTVKTGEVILRRIKS